MGVLRVVGYASLGRGGAVAVAATWRGAIVAKTTAAAPPSWVQDPPSRALTWEAVGKAGLATAIAATTNSFRSGRACSPRTAG